MADEDGLQEQRAAVRDPHVLHAEVGDGPGRAGMHVERDRDVELLRERKDGLERGIAGHESRVLGRELPDDVEAARRALLPQEVEVELLRVLEAEAGDDPLRVLALPALNGPPVVADYGADDIVTLEGAEGGFPMLGLRRRVGARAGRRVRDVRAHLPVVVRVDVDVDDPARGLWRAFRPGDGWSGRRRRDEEQSRDHDAHRALLQLPDPNLFAQSGER